ncbi:MAG: YmaF family protein [Desulfotomaculaceae bacterium]
MLNQQHVHHFSGVTSFNFEHLHRFRGITSPEIGQGTHTHRIRVKTTVEKAHDHEIDIQTGPEIPTPWGHIHNFSGFTNVSSNLTRSHHFKNITGLL